MLCLENLFIYLDYIAYCYADNYEEQKFDKERYYFKNREGKEVQRKVGS